ncbi:23S rRNA (uracil(1939)-C(5))-methyltransferase RlmD [Tissierella sp.]|uniref:23S rRNA (uracil(1939)-C(5))-methyltransferase RlmD n=1 Tax=Tissierella sp. TaxID=41274 RepID=UPI00285F235C|nr:23S rRNA (uracil(1939)-C(5))-methyltransferase RlmD [Tissierella sp.]MDR7855489.1 23S rRNA (uracil(1939)-C(5))-methyltransferase RlmD [Tissierella sp.]
MVKKNELIEFEIKEVAFPNKGKALYGEHNIRFKGGIEGQKVEARVSRKRKGIIESKIVNVLEKSPMETEVGCPHFGICGGCTYQTLSYENELILKEKQVRDLFEQEELEINFLGIEKSPIVEGYRNKMEYTFGDEEKDGPLALGLHRKGRFYEIANVEECNIVDKDFTTILATVLNYFKELKTSFYNKRSHTGFLRHLVVRKAISTGEILVNLVTSSQEELNKENFLTNIRDGSLCLQGKIVGVLHTTNDSLSDVVKADKLDLLYGRDYIVEEMLGLRFNISPFSFFQTNTLGAEKLYTMVRDFAGDIDDKLVFDLYSGTGTIAQIMAPVAKKVIGIEIVGEAVDKAHENAKLNNLDNVEFIAGDVLKAVDDLNEKPDLIVIDPPRDGIHPKAINKIIDFNPETFVYVSCNPVTLVRDLKVFIERGYKIEKVKCMDQFPRTPHVETVTLLTRSEASCK